MRFVHFLYVLVLFTPVVSFAQNNTNSDLERLRQSFAMDIPDREQRVAAYLAESILPAQWQVQDRFIEILDVQKNRPLFYTTLNLSAAKTIRVDKVWETQLPGFQFSGEGFNRAAIWDYKGVLTTHQEFNNNGVVRVVQKDSPGEFQSHPTHCAGSMIAAGVRSNAKGMAPGAHLFAYDWSSDSYEMTMAAGLDNILVSNHSYGIVAGWTRTATGEWYWFGNLEISETEDYMFGLYDAIAKNWDAIAFNAPNYLIVKAAGNDVGEGPSSPTGPPNDGGDDGFDTVLSAAVAKNVLTVGSAFDVADYQDAGDVQISSFSSRGPTDDGRIKPDIVTNGYFVTSCTSAGNEAYGVSSGTSMSGANMAGALILLQDYYLQLHEQPMRSSTLKALVIHTADECGAATGPDYVYGWGLANIKRGIDLLTSDQSLDLIKEDRLINGEMLTIPIHAFGNEPLKATLVWTDPPGTPTEYLLDPTDAMLVNNLDLLVTDQNAFNSYLPFVLNRFDPAQPAIHAENNVDNVEQVVVDNPQAGEYEIIISHKDELLYGSQHFSLIISGASFDVQAPEKTSGVTVEEGY